MGKWNPSSEELKRYFLSHMKTYEGIEHKIMFGYPCCFKNHYMFTGLHEDNWVIKLSNEDLSSLFKEGALPFEPLGRRMKQYVILPKHIIDNEKELSNRIKRSISYIETLPPKK